MHPTLANLKFNWEGPSNLLFSLEHLNDLNDVNCGGAVKNCNKYKRSVGIIKSSDGQCVKSLNCDGRPDHGLPEYYKNFKCVTPSGGNDDIIQ